MKWVKYDKEKREKALELRDKGMTYEEIAEQLGVSTTTVWRLVNLYQEEGGDGNRGIKSKKGELEQRVEQLENYLNEIRLWLYSLGLVGRLRVSRNTKWVCRYLDAEGYCKYWKFEQDPDFISTKTVDGKYCLMHVVEKPIVCVGCPAYMPLASSGEGAKV